jgi:hypothetical protein
VTVKRDGVCRGRRAARTTGLRDGSARSSIKDSQNAVTGVAFHLMEASMIHTLFWLTGIVTWFLIALVCAMWLVAEILERSVIRRARNG